MLRLISYAFDEITFSESVMLTQPFVHGKPAYRTMSLPVAFPRPDRNSSARPNSEPRVGLHHV